jgi:hypothetical protein
MKMRTPVKIMLISMPPAGASQYYETSFCYCLPLLASVYSTTKSHYEITETSEMADWQFWGVVNHRWGSDARLQFEPCQPFGQNPKQTIGQNLIDL